MPQKAADVTAHFCDAAHFRGGTFSWRSTFVTQYEINTGRGLYRLSLAAPPAITADEITLTLSFERADGLERVGFLCTIARALAEASDHPNSGPEAGAILARLVPWFEREFEQTREAALKSLRSERKPLTVRFDREHRGPFSG
jgi:hypothetical protein